MIWRSIVEPTTKLRSPEGAEYYSPGRKSWVSLRTSESRRDGRNETGRRTWERHAFSRAATVLQSCHSEPSVAALYTARACPERSRRDERGICFWSAGSLWPIFLHREIRIRARLQPCRQSPPKLSFRAVRNRACAARACPERSEGTREESPFGPPVHL